jgi:thioredoxin 1
MQAQTAVDSSANDVYSPVGLTVDQLNTRLQASSKLVLVYFKADWCVVCKRQKPILDAVVAENKSKVKLFEIDMEDNPLIAEYFEVDGLPVTILYKQGKIMWDRMGLTQKKELEEQLRFFE